ncbi:sensory box/GGDEF family protein [Vibrio maritimus]|uniref:Sensory box/GGDEF family protein n=1 Tax=Vibrio maritimus TaxID=990268 RepID=A0A090T053_9VIBR|nr:sensory box/GGDEF family protein [Vibrio maritimus]
MRIKDCVEQFPISIVKIVLATITACVLAVNVITIDRINQINEDLSDRKNEATWFILQLVKEYSNFIKESHIKPLNRDRLWLAYDLTWSRFDIILNSKESSKFIEQASYKAFIDSQFNKFKALERSLVLLDTEPQIQDALTQRIEVNFEEMIHFINEKFQIESPITERNRTELQRLLTYQKASTVALVVLFLLISCVFWVDSKLRRTIQRKDALTCLLNRTALTNDIKHHLKHPIYHLLSIRILNIPEINQKYGIDYGDVLIQVAADRVANCLTNDFALYRYSGSQFLVLSNTPDVQITPNLQQSIKDALAEPIELSDMALILDITIHREANLVRRGLIEKLTQLSKKPVTAV